MSLHVTLSLRHAATTRHSPPVPGLLSRLLTWDDAMRLRFRDTGSLRGIRDCGANFDSTAPYKTFQFQYKLSHTTITLPHVSQSQL